MTKGPKRKLTKRLKCQRRKAWKKWYKNHKEQDTPGWQKRRKWIRSRYLDKAAAEERQQVPHLLDQSYEKGLNKGLNFMKGLIKLWLKRTEGPIRRQLVRVKELTKSMEKQESAAIRLMKVRRQLNGRNRTDAET